MTTAPSVTSVTTLLKTVLARPYHYRRNGLYYFRMRPKGVTSHSFTVSLRTTDRTTAMDISKDIQRALAVFHLDNVEATWLDIKPRLLDIALDCLQQAHGDDSVRAYDMVYEELKASLGEASVRKSLPVDHHKALQVGRAILTAAQDRLHGQPENLLQLIESLQESDPVNGDNRPSVPSSVSALQVPLSWDELSGHYLKEHSVNLKPTTMQSLSSHIKHIGVACTAIDLKDLRGHTRANLIELRTELLETRKASTVNAMLTTLQAILDWGVSNDYLSKAYTSRLKFTKGVDSERVAFSTEQVKTLMERLSRQPADSWKRWGLELIVVTGARVGEVSQLTRDDIKEVDGHWCIHIHEEGGERTVKSKHSTRTIPLTDGAYGFALHAFLKAVENGALASEHVGKWELARKTLGNHLRILLKDSRQENQTLHSLRHHLASAMQAQGIPVAYTEAVLGHASNSISYDTYGSGVPVKALAEVLKRTFTA